MFTLFETPIWFSGIDLVFDIITILIALLIAGYSWKVAKLCNENKYKYFSFAFILVAIAFMFKFGTSATLYYSSIREVADHTLRPLTQGIVTYNDMIYRFGYFMQMASLLGAWLLVFFISQKSRDRLKKYYEIAQMGLFVYLVTLLAVIATFKPFVFYLTATVILSMIVLNYYKNYLNSGKKWNSILVMLSFFFILIGHVFFTFLFIWNGFYIPGELFMLAGFLLIFYVYRKVVGSR